MELPQIGKQCSLLDCQQLDFLPFICHCKKVFCQDHFHQHASDCHIQSQIKTGKCEKALLCSQEGCKNSSAITIPCTKCGQSFCIPHRHFATCGQELTASNEEVKQKESRRLESNTAALLVDAEVTRNIEAAKMKEKSSQMANKVFLMRLKSRAVGLSSVPVSERVYFHIDVLQKGINVKPVYVCKEWALGRAVDYLADMFKLENRNNITAARKLRLMSAEGAITGEHMSAKIRQLISQEVLCEGETLGLNYIDS